MRKSHSLTRGEETEEQSMSNWDWMIKKKTKAEFEKDECFREGGIIKITGGGKMGTSLKVTFHKRCLCKVVPIPTTKNSSGGVSEGRNRAECSKEKIPQRKKEERIIYCKGKYRTVGAFRKGGRQYAPSNLLTHC